MKTRRALMLGQYPGLYPKLLRRLAKTAAPAPPSTCAGNFWRFLFHLAFTGLCGGIASAIYHYLKN